MVKCCELVGASYKNRFEAETSANKNEDKSQTARDGVAMRELVLGCFPRRYIKAWIDVLFAGGIHRAGSAK